MSPAAILASIRPAPSATRSTPSCVRTPAASAASPTLWLLWRHSDVKPFRFRAQAAIDLRQREYDDARRVLAHALLDLRAAEEVRTEADARIIAAREQGAREMR